MHVAPRRRAESLRHEATVKHRQSRTRVVSREIREEALLCQGNHVPQTVEELLLDSLGRLPPQEHWLAPCVKHEPSAQVPQDLPGDEAGRSFRARGRVGWERFFFRRSRCAGARGRRRKQTCEDPLICEDPPVCENGVQRFDHAVDLRTRLGDVVERHIKASQKPRANDPPICRHAKGRAKPRVELLQQIGRSVALGQVVAQVGRDVCE